MRSFYRHTQTSHLLRWATVPCAIGLFAAGYVAGKALLFSPIAVLLGFIGWIFCTLTVEVTTNELIWYFGPGVWRKSIARDDVVSATPVRNKWWWGWGIHRTPRGWLYNVAGLEAVEIALSNGRTLRIGSDEVNALVNALRR